MEKMQKTHKKGIAMLIYGQSGSGKTASCRNLPPDKTLWFATEDTQSAATLQGHGWNDWNVIRPRTRRDVDMQLTGMKQYQPYDYIVFDTISGLYDVYLEDISSLNGKMPSQMGVKLYQLAHEAWDTTWKLINEIKGKGVHFILLSHMKLKEEDMSDSRKLNKGPDLPGKAQEGFCSRVPLVAQSLSYTVNQKSVYKLQFKPLVDGDYGMDKYGIFGLKEPNDVLDIITRVQTHLGKIEPKDAAGGAFDATEPPPPTQTPPEEKKPPQPEEKAVEEAKKVEEEKQRRQAEAPAGSDAGKLTKNQWYQQIETLANSMNFKMSLVKQICKRETGLVYSRCSLEGLAKVYDWLSKKAEERRARAGGESQQSNGGHGQGRKLDEIDPNAPQPIPF